jgi:hypothetical protein
MKPPKDRGGAEEVGLEETSKEEELGEEDQLDDTTVMRKVTWKGIVLKQDNYGAHTVEPMDTQLKTT